MARPEDYHQGTLDFQRPEPKASPQPQRRDSDVSPSAPVTQSAGSRLDNDQIPEYLFELQNRERLELPAVSLDEFEDMRDFSDGITVYLDIEKPEPPYDRRGTR